MAANSVAADPVPAADTVTAADHAAAAGHAAASNPVALYETATGNIEQLLPTISSYSYQHFRAVAADPIE